MRLYEIKTKINMTHGRASSLVVTRQETVFKSSQLDARRLFNLTKRDEATIEATLSIVTVDTHLKTRDWIQLLESDAPGNTCTMTPVDRITSRQLLKEWTSKPKDKAA